METLGYEFALFISLIASCGAGQLAACYPHRVRSQLAPFPGARYPALVLYGRVLFPALLLVTFPLILALLNRTRVPPCNEIEGLAFYALMPVCSVVIAAAVGLFLGLVFPGAKSASVLWFALFVGSLAMAFHRFYSAPAVYLFGPLFGYFPGVLYDKLVHVETRLITYRVGTLIQTAALLGLATWLLDPTSVRLTLKRLPRLRVGLVTIFFCAVAAVMYLAGPRLSHRTDRAALKELLSRKTTRGQLDIYFPPGTDSWLVEALSDDAAFSLRQVEQYLGIEADRRIAVFFFASTAQKAAAMGAAGTNVAKPWRSEVYVMVDVPPHSVLRHELAHAVAARIGRGPFAIAGSLGGLWPDPGRIEGLATAAQGPRGDLTVHQWAAAMKRLELLRPLKSIFGLGFFNVTASAAYTAAGSFCGYVRDTFGAPALVKFYRSGDLQAATGKEAEVLEKDWLKFLGEVPLRDEDLTAAKHRFDRPAVIHSVCVHEVARLQAEAGKLSRGGVWNEALEILGEAHERSGRATSTRLQIFFALADAGLDDQVRKQAKELLVDDSMSSVSKAVFEEILADFDWVSGRRERARRVFSDLALRARSEADRRRLEVKAHLTTLTPESSGRLPSVLAKRPGPRAVSPPLAALTISAAAHARPEDPILTYLLARQHFNQRDYVKAITLLDTSERLGLGLTTDSLWAAARMLRAQAAFYLGKLSEAKALFQQITRDQSTRLATRATAHDWAVRCAFRK